MGERLKPGEEAAQSRDMCAPVLVVVSLLLAAHLFHSLPATNLPPWPRLIPHSWPALRASRLLWSDICVLSNAYTEIPMPSVMLWGGGGAFGGVLSSWGWGQCSCKRDPTELPSPPCHVRTQWEVWSLQEGSQQNLTVLALWSWTSRLHNS